MVSHAGAWPHAVPKPAIISLPGDGASSFIPPLGLCRLLPNAVINYPAVFPLVPLWSPWLCRGMSVIHTWGQGASVQLKGKYKKEKGPACCLQA